jgi:exodeoxyribonuclease-5
MNAAAAITPEPAPAHRKLTVRDLSPDQREAYDAVLAWKKSGRKLFTLAGYAGSGKSSVVSVLAASGAWKKIAFATMTGKAASVLGGKLAAVGVSMADHSCGTVHRLIYRPNTDPKTGAVLGWHRRPSLDGDPKLLVIDEASMVDDETLVDLQSYGVPILAVGDHGQLPPVRGGGSLMRTPDVRLEKIHRQAEGSPILKLSAAVRETGVLPRDLEDGRAVRFIRRSDIGAFIAFTYAEMQGAEAHERAILSWSNAQRVRLNHLVRQARFGRNVPGEPVPRDQVICLRNDSESGFYNGMRGFLVSPRIDREGRDYLGSKVRFVDEDFVVRARMLRAQFGRPKTFASLDELGEVCVKRPKSWKGVGHFFDFGAAMTTHKSQGSQFRSVLVDCARPGAASDEEWKRWAYTSTTRASHELVLAV